MWKIDYKDLFVADHESDYFTEKVVVNLRLLILANLYNMFLVQYNNTTLNFYVIWTSICINKN